MCSYRELCEMWHFSPQTSHQSEILHSFDILDFTDFTEQSCPACTEVSNGGVHVNLVRDISSVSWVQEWAAWSDGRWTDDERVSNKHIPQMTFNKTSTKRGIRSGRPGATTAWKRSGSCGVLYHQPRTGRPSLLHRTLILKNGCHGYLIKGTRGD